MQSEMFKYLWNLLRGVLRCAITRSNIDISTARVASNFLHNEHEELRQVHGFISIFWNLQRKKSRDVFVALEDSFKKKSSTF